MFPVILLTILLTVWICKVMKQNWKYKDFDGPSSFLSLPMVGHAWLLGDSKPITKMMEYRDKYGDMFKFDIGGMPSIMLCTHELVKEAFFKDVFSGRSWNEIPTLAAGLSPSGEDGKPVMSVTLADPPLWGEMRKFMLKNLTNLGMGNLDSMEDIIDQEADQVAKTFEGMSGQPIKSSSLFINPVNNIIWRISTGKRSKHDDPDMIALTNNIKKAFKGLDQSDPRTLIVLNNLNIAKLFQKLGWSNFLDSCNVVMQRIREEIKAAKPDETGNYIERALYERESRALEGKRCFLGGSDGIGTLEAQLLEMFFAGTETSATFMEWLILYCLIYPKVQERMYEEISMLTQDNSRQISLDDRENAHYINCVIDEIARHGPLLLVPAGRKALSDTVFRGKLIPKGTQVLPFHYAINQDPKIYPNPREFNPERFLVKDGNVWKYSKEKQPIFFGVGKRRCPGELLARAEIFLFATRIIQKFRLVPADPASLSMDALSRLVMAPKTFEFIAEPRKQ